MVEIHVLGRLILPSQGMVLLSRKVGREYTYLPGGHVEHGEGVQRALRRELMEEFGGKVEIGRFVAALEHAYRRADGTLRHEVNLVFLGQLLTHNASQPPQPVESRLTFFWHPIERLGEVNLCPAPLVEIIQDLYQMGATRSWASTLGE